MASTPFNLLDLFSAQGVMAQSIVFYGAYTNQTLNFITSHAYNIPQAYFMTLLIVYLVTVIVISINVGKSYRDSFIEAVDSMPNIYAHKLFSSWNFNICSQKAADLKHIQIYHEINNALADIHSKKARDGRWQTSVCAWTMHVSVHILVLCMLAGFGLVQWSMLHAMEVDYVYTSFWSSMWTAYMINVALVVMQLFLRWIAR